MKASLIPYHLKSFAAHPVKYLKCMTFHYPETYWATESGHCEGWEERNQMMAGLIRPGSSVLEFGAGMGFLQKHLPESCRYQPCDLYPTTEQTIVCDLNQSFPSLMQRYDYIVLSGVVEYIHDLPKLFTQIRNHTDECVVSFCPMDKLSCMITRKGWTHHLFETEIRQLFQDTGFSVSQELDWKNYQTIYHLASSKQ